MTDDAELLRTYAESGSEPPFAELVRRHVDLVHTAVWLTGPKSPRAWLRSRLDLATGDVRPVVKTP